MGTRYKPIEGGKLESLDDVNMALRDIGLIERELEDINTDLNKQTAKLKSDAEKRAKPLKAKIKELTTRVKAYAEYNRDDLFDGRKSIELTFGMFGYRKSTKISIRKSTLELLEKLKLNEFIRIKKEPDKEKMAEMSNETLAQVDAVRKVSDAFFCEAKVDVVRQDVQQSA
jgi:phage host-nuclease inhibitor protein Gam